MLTNFKSLLTSKTFRGIFISLIAIILQMFDIHIIDQEGYTTDFVQIAGSLFAIYGRIVATEKIL